VGQCGYQFVDETGNFQNNENEPVSDPRQNRFYPTDDASYQAGINIDDFFEGDGRTSILGEVDHLNNCAHQAIMCCFGRDRQYGDGNGDCRRRDCDNANPGDNTNICYVDEGVDSPIAYPSDEIAHCHGLAWSDDENDPSFKLRFNNFFYVVMHDQ